MVITSNVSARDSSIRSNMGHSRSVSNSVAPRNQRQGHRDLTKASHKIYAETRLFGIVLVIFLSALLLFASLLALLWEINLLMGNFNPPWYKWYMKAYKKRAVAVILAVAFSTFALLLALSQIFTRALLTKLLATIPTLTTILYASGMLPGKNRLFATIMANDMFYFVVDSIARLLGGYGLSIGIFFLIEFVFRVVCAGLVDHVEVAVGDVQRL